MDRPRLAPLALAFLLLSAGLLAGCSRKDGGEEGAEPSVALREHVLAASMLAFDYRLLAAAGTLPYGLDANPGQANASVLAAGGVTPVVAYASLWARPARPTAEIHSVAVEFASRDAAARWAAAAPRPAETTQYVLVDGNFVTLVAGPGAELRHLEESARHLAETLDVRARCQAGTWPPPLQNLPDPRANATLLLDGATPVAALAEAGEERWYLLNASNETFLNVDLTVNGTGAPLVQLRGPDLLAVTTAGPAPVEGVTSRLQGILRPGESYLRILPFEPCVTGHQYRLQVDRVPTAADGNGHLRNATVVSVGQRGPYTLYPATDEDWYAVRLNATSRLTLAVFGADGELGGLTRLILYREDGTVVDQRTNPERGSDRGEMGNDLDAGWYYFRVLPIDPEVVYRYYVDVIVETPPPPPIGGS